MRLAWARVALVSTVCLNAVASASHSAKDFSVADGITMTSFTDPDGGFGPIKISPDGRYVAIVVERGVLEKNVVEDTVLAWKIEDIVRSAQSSGAGKPSVPMELARMTDRNGPDVSNLIWLDDSSGVMFLARGKEGNDQLFVADIGRRNVRAVSADAQDVSHFAATNGNVIYTARSLVSAALQDAQRQTDTTQAAFAGTGLDLHDLLFPSDIDALRFSDRSELWTAIDGQRRRVDTTGFPQPLHFDRFAYALSPDGRFAVMSSPVASVPEQWESYGMDAVYGRNMTLRAGPQDLGGESGFTIPHQFVLVDLARGTVTPLIDAPDADSRGFWHWDRANASWSPDGKSVIVPATFLPIDTGMSAEMREERLRHPCVAVVELATGTAACVEPLKGSGEEDLHAIRNVHFSAHDDKEIVISYDLVPTDRGYATEIYHLQRDGHWQLTGGAANSTAPVELKVRQDLNDPPKLVAVDKKSDVVHIVFDPNPQFRGLSLSRASVVRWKDQTGQPWAGGLVLPAGYVRGKRFPLVLQTHGFRESEFISSGSFTSAFAARPLAAAGIMVLQLPDGCPARMTSDEVSCEIAGYKAGVQKLIADGLVDAQRVGIIGFSRTCMYTLAALTDSRLRFAAATINDGFTMSYLQYLLSVDSFKNYAAGWMDAMIGTAPFGPGLEQWLSQSPVFNMNKVAAPVRIEAVGRESVLFMWEPYAALRYLHKPVDLIVLQSGTHPLTNPAQRLASQGGNVDWFRFWLQAYEDPDSAKSEQYRRWEKLCDMQMAQIPNQPTFCVRTKAH